MYVAFVVQKRKEKGISQAEIAKVLGISRRQWQRIEDGSSGMSLGMFVRVCDELGLKILLVDKELLK